MKWRVDGIRWARGERQEYWSRQPIGYVIVKTGGRVELLKFGAKTWRLRASAGGRNQYNPATSLYVGHKVTEAMRAAEIHFILNDGIGDHGMDYRSLIWLGERTSTGIPWE